MNTLTDDNPNVLVFAATNHLEDMDPSLVPPHRFNHRMYIPAPDLEARREMAVNLFEEDVLLAEENGFQVFAGDVNAVKIAELTDKLSGAAIAEIFRRLSTAKAMEEIRTRQQPDPVTQAEIERAIWNFRQSD